jgi:hypothetical protein
MSQYRTDSLRHAPSYIELLMRSSTNRTTDPVGDDIMKITSITVAVILSAGLFSAELGTIKNISHRGTWPSPRVIDLGHEPW